MTSIMKRTFTYIPALVRVSKTICLAICIAVCAPALSQENYLEINEINDFQEVDKLIAEHVADKQIPGLAYCLVKGKKMIWSGAAGWADLEKEIPMSIDGIMNIASISKTFTATAIMQLWENELVSLDADISEYVPSLIRNPHHPHVPITIYQLLTHTSSIKDGDSYDASYSDGDPVLSLREWIQNYLLPGGDYFDAASNFHPWLPGAESAYSNVGFGLLGYIVEQVTGIPFNTYCKIHILDPLGMFHSGWFLHEIDTTAHIRPYSFQQNKDSISFNKALNLYSFPNYPDGLLRTSVRELSYFLMAIINKGSFEDARILKKSTVKKMLTVQIEGVGQGLCWEQTRYQSLWGHSGGDPGVATHMFFSPRTKIGVITFQNNHNGDLFSILRLLYTTAKEEY